MPLDVETRRQLRRRARFVSVSLAESGAPSAVADVVILYAEDNGAGKTKLMAQFPTGAAVQIAIEP
jgi:hypothetical protein